MDKLMYNDLRECLLRWISSKGVELDEEQLTWLKDRELEREDKEDE